MMSTTLPSPVLVDKDTFDSMLLKEKKYLSCKSTKTLKSLPYSAQESNLESQTTNKTKSFVLQSGPKSDDAEPNKE